MDTEQIIQELKAERIRLDAAINALQSGGSRTSRSKGRRGPRHMTAEARRRISEAQKRRWAKRRSSGAAAVGRSTRRRKGSGMSAAGRKKISEMMKKRWADRKKKAA